MERDKMKKVDDYYKSRRPEKTWEKIVDKIDWGNKTVLDVGCYYGWFLFAAIDAGAKEAIGIGTNKYQNLSKQKGFIKPFDFVKKQMKAENISEGKIGLIAGDWFEIKPPMVDIVLCLNTAWYFSAKYCSWEKDKKLEYGIQKGIKKVFEHAKEYVVFETSQTTEHKDFELVFQTQSHWNERKIRVFKRK